MAPHRKKWLIAGSVVVVIVTSLATAISRRQTSAFPELYKLANGIGSTKYAPLTMPSAYVVRYSRGSSSGTATRFKLAALPHATTRMTILAFDKSDEAKVEQALDRRFPQSSGLYLWAVTPGTMLKSGRPTNIVMVKSRSDDRFTADLLKGPQAEQVAKDAGIALPKDGFVVALSEDTDWWAARLKVVLRACGLD